MDPVDLTWESQEYLDLVIAVAIDQCEVSRLAEARQLRRERHSQRHLPLHGRLNDCKHAPASTAQHTPALLVVGLRCILPRDWPASTGEGVPIRLEACGRQKAQHCRRWWWRGERAGCEQASLVAVEGAALVPVRRRVLSAAGRLHVIAQDGPPVVPLLSLATSPSCHLARARPLLNIQYLSSSCAPRVGLETSISASPLSVLRSLLTPPHDTAFHSVRHC